MKDFLKEKIRQYQSSILDGIVKHHPFLGLEQRAEYFVRIFETYLPAGSDILDIGGRWGFYAAPLEKRGHSVTVLDVVKPGLQKSPVVLYHPENPFPFADKSFDISLLITVLHHIPDPLKVLREAKRVTRRTLIVIEDIYNHEIGRLWTRLRDQFYNVEFFGHPCQFKNKKEWSRLFEGEGFSARHESQVYTWLAGLRILNGLFVLDVGT